MAVPISYNIRNLILRKGATIMTALGIALTVATAIFILALLAGLRDAFQTSGDPNNVLRASSVLAPPSRRAIGMVFERNA